MSEADTRDGLAHSAMCQAWADCRSPVQFFEVIDRAVEFGQRMAGAAGAGDCVCSRCGETGPCPYDAQYQVERPADCREAREAT